MITKTNFIEKYWIDKEQRFDLNFIIDFYINGLPLYDVAPNYMLYNALYFYEAEKNDLENEELIYEIESSLELTSLIEWVYSWKNSTKFINKALKTQKRFDNVNELLRVANNLCTHSIYDKIRRFLINENNKINNAEDKNTEIDDRLTTRFILRIPNDFIEKIDLKRKQEVGNQSRNTWILQTIADKFDSK